MALAQTWYMQQFDLVRLKALLAGDPLNPVPVVGTFLWLVGQKLDMLKDPKTAASLRLKLADELMELNVICAETHPEYVLDCAAIDAAKAEESDGLDDLPEPEPVFEPWRRRRVVS